MTDSVDEIKARCFVNAPFDRLQQGMLQTLLENRIQPEIGLEGLCLYHSTTREFQQVARALKGAGLSCTLHAPFYDLSPGASDPEILKATRNKLRKAFDLIDIFEARSIVCHLAYEENKHGFNHRQWQETAVETWGELLLTAHRSGTPVMLENTYEATPAQHRDLLKTINSPLLRFCLDAGHVLAFAHNTWQDWLPELSPWLGQLHLHDNNGDFDQHLAIGEGRFDFAGLFDYLIKANLRPILTLEPHQEPGLRHSLKKLATFELPHPPLAP